ncbi:hypothetical protein DPSP01_004145 [Paraphaeosphaeria sporulosa]|uniref:Uncharacterized protein n=1 Tax=Paraphaeosphaeria sporulosa TaxID=1460663 RepID=A0A177CD78_9PLEO|nr:uncharacterized protein CC84DRAFT_1176838 [Paraphaeosphaeria sporulosa]OAG04650.1 hypothetical protein CC84DRAFT_1176838 [Paraphaeosphaeria sporulosa]
MTSTDVGNIAITGAAGYMYRFQPKICPIGVRGLVKSTTPEVWPSTEAAAEGLRVPAELVEYLWNSGDDTRTAGMGSAPPIKWQPNWAKEKLLRHIDEEIDALLELGKAKNSLIASLFAAAKESSPRSLPFLDCS